MRELACGNCGRPTCRLCQLAAEGRAPPAAYKDYAPPGKPERVAVPVFKDCPHRGDVVDEVKCGPCRGKVSTKVYACAKYGTCTTGKRLAGHHVCDGGCG